MTKREKTQLIKVLLKEAGVKARVKHGSRGLEIHTTPLDILTQAQVYKIKTIARGATGRYSNCAGHIMVIEAVHRHAVETGLPSWSKNRRDNA